MIRLTAIALSIALACLPACATPLPATAIHLSWIASPDAAVASQTVYEWKPTDSDWVVLQSVSADTSDIVLSNPTYGTRYTVTASDAAGNESPMSNVATNFNLATPGGLKVKR